LKESPPDIGTSSGSAKKKITGKRNPEGEREIRVLKIQGELKNSYIVKGKEGGIGAWEVKHHGVRACVN